MADLYNYGKRAESGLAKIKEICEETYSDVSAFAKHLKANGCSDGRIFKHVYFLKTLRLLAGRSFRELTKDDIVEMVSKINSDEIEVDGEIRQWKESTKSEFRGILKMYFKWLKKSEDYPPEVCWIKWGMKRNKEMPPEQILSVEEIELIAGSAYNHRDKALILTLYESGCRISEFLNMKIKDVRFDDYGCYIMVSGKTGWRRVRIIDYSKNLHGWLDAHPSKSNQESFVWVNLENYKQVVKPTAINAMLKKLAKRVGIQKPVHPHSFRHARATHLAKVLPEAVMKKMFGWTNDSDMASVYISISGKDVDDALLKLHGIKTEEVKDKKVSGMRICSKCGDVNSLLSHFCKKCNYPLDLKMILEAEENRKSQDEFLSKFLTFYATKDPTFKKIFVEFVKENKAENLFN